MPMDIETTGYLLVNDSAGKSERIIAVNTDFKKPDGETDVVFKKSRFITAHEYGHFILHRKECQAIYMHRDTSHRTEKIELEADYSAKNILMPYQQFSLYYEIVGEMCNGDVSFITDILSKLFNVTKNKAKKRMEDLSTLTNEAGFSL